MTKELHSRPTGTRIISFLGALFLSVYGLSYWALVRPGLMLRDGGLCMAPFYVNQKGTQKELEIQNALETLFWPVHKLDRVLRPATWDFDPM